MHLNQIRQKYSSAYDKFVDLLVEDCAIDFQLIGGRLYAHDTVEGKWMLWDHEDTDVEMSVGWPWVECDNPRARRYQIMSIEKQGSADWCYISFGEDRKEVVARAKKFAAADDTRFYRVADRDALIDRRERFIWSSADQE